MSQSNRAGGSSSHRALQPDVLPPAGHYNKQKTLRLLHNLDLEDTSLFALHQIAVQSAP